MSMRAVVNTFDVEAGSPARKLIIIALADNANDAGLANPDLNIIASRCEMTKKTVQRHIAAMEADGLLEIVRRFEDVVQLPNWYQLHPMISRGKHEY